MLSDRDALLAAIRDNPEEDTPRLMFADWLDEEGGEENSARAEFIRLQCELARLADDGSGSQPVFEFVRDRDWVTRPSADWPLIDDGLDRRIAFLMRSEDLFKRHGEGWLPKLPRRHQVQWVALPRDRFASNFHWLSSSFHRGFPHRVALNKWHKRTLSELAPLLRASAPTVTLVAGHFSDRSARQLADFGLLAGVRGLDLGGDCWAGLREFGSRPEAAGVRTIAVRSDAYESAAEIACALGAAPHCTGLRELDLGEIAMPADGAEALFGSKHLRSLRRLNLRSFGHGIGVWPADTLRAFAAGDFGNLVSLRLAHCGLDDDAAEVLANCPHLAKLRSLDLPNNSLTGRGVTALLTSPHLANVAYLGVEGNPGNGLDAGRLAEVAPGSLRMFHAHGCRFRTADVRALARCPRMRTLWYLDLDDNNLGTPAVRELVRACKDWCPPILWLTRNRIDDRGADLLAKWKASQGMSVLHLRYNQITEAGVKALLASNYLANLDGLGVDASDPDLLARLRHRFRHFDTRY